MTELVLKVDEELATRFRKIVLVKFNGDDALALESALKYLLSEGEREMVLLEQIVRNIQDEIETSGGVSEKK